MKTDKEVFKELFGEVWGLGMTETSTADTSRHRPIIPRKPTNWWRVLYKGILGLGISCVVALCMAFIYYSYEAYGWGEGCRQYHNINNNIFAECPISVNIEEWGFTVKWMTIERPWWVQVIRILDMVVGLVAFYVILLFGAAKIPEWWSTLKRKAGVS